MTLIDWLAFVELSLLEANNQIIYARKTGTDSEHTKKAKSHLAEISNDIEDVLRKVAKIKRVAKGQA